MSSPLECTKVAIPLENLVKRYENVITCLWKVHDRSSWWQWRKRQRALGGIAVLQVEIAASLELGAKAQPVLRDAPRKNRKDDRTYKPV